jgi:hypothetical protein
LLRRLGPGKITVIVIFRFDKTLAEEYAILSMLQTSEPPSYPLAAQARR